MTSLRLQTPRLLLVAATLEHALAEGEDLAKLSALLDAEVPPTWPPPLNDDQSHAWFTDRLRADPDSVGWSMWYFLLERPGLRRLAIGNGGLKGRPSAEGTAEIGYSLMPAFHRQGLAPEAVGALIEWTFGHPEITRIIAHTLPELRASIRVLEKSGFTFTGPGEEPETIAYELKRADWEARR
jgi:RimJ/RimL family protein N-acetyltransferase